MWALFLTWTLIQFLLLNSWVLTPSFGLVVYGPWILRSSDGISHFSGIFPLAQGGLNPLLPDSWVVEVFNKSFRQGALEMPVLKDKKNWWGYWTSPWVLTGSDTKIFYDAFFNDVTLMHAFAYMDTHILVFPCKVMQRAKPMDYHLSTT